MRLAGKIFWVTMSSVVASSCFDPPEFPVVPEIAYENHRFVDMPDTPGEYSTDSLILEISFKDGDGNLGLGSTELGSIQGDKVYFYNDRWYYTTELIDDCDDNPNDGVNRCFDLNLDLLNAGKYVTYKLKRNPVNGSDTLKEFIKPYNCTNWEVTRDQTGTVRDTVYFQLNPYYNNIFVEFQIKLANTECQSPPCFKVFDWSQYLDYPNCGVQGFNGRFPYLNTESLGPTPLAGVIKYSMPSPFFKSIFGSRTIRLRVWIVDRELNRSNDILTPEFSL
jgi:hypothetical protein